MKFRTVAFTALALLAFAASYRFWLIHRTVAAMEDTSTGAFTGPADARNVVVEFMDYRCAYCRTISPEIKEFAKRNPDVLVVYRHLPVYVAPSVREASLALAAAKQGKFMPVHDYLAGREMAVTDEEIPAIARQFGLDQDRLQQDMKGVEIARVLVATLDSSKVLGIRGTPAFLLNGTLYAPRNGLPPVEQFEAIFKRYRR